MDPTATSNILLQLARQQGNIDHEVNRARADHANRLRQLTGQKVTGQKQISQGFADRGTLHSGINSASQIGFASALDEKRQSLNQGLNDTLANAARRKIEAQTQFNISSLIPS